jgi:membrane protein
MAARTQAPDSPVELQKRSWWLTLKRTVKEFQDDNLTDWAAALTYYGLLALFPALLVLVALLGVFGQFPRTTNALFQILSDAGADPNTIKSVRGPVEGVIKSKGGAGALLGFGLVLALWSASSYIGAFIRAANAVYEINEGRPFWKLRPLQLLITLLGTILLALVLVAIVVSGPLAKAIGSSVGLGDAAVTAWNIAKWPVILVVVMAMVAGLYYLAPNIRHPKFRWVSPGGVLFVVLWILATVGFFFYVSNFGSYNKTYGTLGGLIVLLVWMWITNVALLFGVEFDAELERSRELEAGLPAEQNIQLEPRQTPKDGPVRTTAADPPVAEGERDEVARGVATDETGTGDGDEAGSDDTRSGARRAR